MTRMSTSRLTDDAKALLLLSGSFSVSGGNYDPLDMRECNRLVDLLETKHLSPAHLLEPGTLSLLEDDVPRAEVERFERLLGRGAALAFVVEQWLNKGIWILCSSDENYPARMKHHLGLQAPPLFYGAGNPELLNGGGLAILGSRNTDSDTLEFTVRVGSHCARQGITVISGAARGIDEAAMMGAGAAGGHVVGVLADSLVRAASSGRFRDGIREDRIVLLSPYHPEAGFSVGAAMGRNKIIYALADYALIVASDYNKGGTWAGATEELKRQFHRPVFVRVNPAKTRGNMELLNRGALRFPEEALEGSIPLEDALSEGGRSSGEKVIQREEKAPKESLSPPTLAAVNPLEIPGPVTCEQLFPELLRYLETPHTIEEVANQFALHSHMAKQWLERACREGRAEKTRGRPVRYRSASCIQQELPLDIK